MVLSTDAPTLQGFVADLAEPDIQVYTDDSSAYVGVDRPHESVNHSTGECVREMARTNGMESFWSTPKRGYIGVYDNMSNKHLHRYVAEFSGRHNVREADTIEQMQHVAAALAGNRLMYRELVAVG